MNYTPICQALFVLLCLLMPFCPLMAQVEVRGVLADSLSAEPIGYATVVAVKQGHDRMAAHAVTDSLGRFVLTLDSPAPHVLTFSCLGYRPRQVELCSVAGMGVLYWALQPDEQWLSTLVVVGKDGRRAARMERGRMVIPMEGTALSAAGSSLDALRRLPGVFVDGAGSVSLSSIGQAAVYVNGKRVRLRGEALVTYLRGLSASRIDRIELIAHPGVEYEADGLGGVIDIRLKNTMNEGLFVESTNGLTQWHHLKQHSSLNLSWGSERVQWTVNYHHEVGHYSYNYGSDRFQDQGRNHSATRDTDKRNTFAGGTNLVWKPAENHELDVSVEVSSLAGSGETHTSTQIYDDGQSLSRRLEASNLYLKQRNTRCEAGLNYTFTPHRQHRLHVSLGMLGLKGMSQNTQPNVYYSPEGAVLQTLLYDADNRKDVGMASVSLAYHMDTRQWGQWRMGLRTAGVKTDNAFSFYEAEVLNPLRSNTFVYKEWNFDAHLSHRLSLGEGLLLETGLRLERMRTESCRLPHGSTQAEVSRNGPIWGVFPSLSLSWEHENVGMWTLNYSRRQDKPAYEDLNEFEYLLDELTFWRANPHLRPQIGNRFALGYNRGSMGLSVGYIHLNDYFTALTDGLSGGRVVMTSKNIGQQQQWLAELVHELRPSKIWTLSLMLGGYYLKNRLHYEGFRQHYGRASLVVSTDHRLRLPWQLNLEVNAAYRSLRQGGSYELVKPSGVLSLQLKRSFLNDALTIGLTATDLLHTERWDSEGIKGSFRIRSWGRGESRRLGLHLHYKLGKQRYRVQAISVDESSRLR